MYPNIHNIYQMIDNFKLSSNIFRNRIYIAWFKIYLQIGMCVQKNFDLNTQNFKRTLKKYLRGKIFLKAVLYVTIDAFQEKLFKNAI